MSNFFVTFSEIRSFSGRTLILQNNLRKISVPNDQFSPHNSSALRFLSLLKKKTLDFGHFSSCTFLLLKIFITREPCIKDCIKACLKAYIKACIRKEGKYFILPPWPWPKTGSLRNTVVPGSWFPAGGGGRGRPRKKPHSKRSKS